MLEVRNLTLKYNQSTKPVVADLNLLTESGNLVMLAGRNGSGKSTLLRTLAGLQQPLGGSVYITGKSLSEFTEEQLAGIVSIMLSTPPLLELTTAGELVITAMSRLFSPFKIDFDEEWKWVESCLKQCGMGEFMRRDFSSLSDGEKQKVMLARCLAQKTPVILLDEPLAFLDYPSRIEMLQLLKSLAEKSNKLIVFSSHDLDISLEYCSQMLILRDLGQWQWIDDAEYIKSIKPRDIFNSHHASSF